MQRLNQFRLLIFNKINDERKQICRLLLQLYWIDWLTLDITVHNKPFLLLFWIYNSANEPKWRNLLTETKITDYVGLNFWTLKKK